MSQPSASTKTAAPPPVAVARPQEPWWSGMSLRPLLFAPGAVALTLLAHARGWNWLLLKANHEVIAPPLLAVTVLLLLLRTWRGRREPLFLALTALSTAFLCREIHFKGTSTLVYVCALAIGLWVWRRWPVMRATLVTWPARGWLVGSFACYPLSQIVARRVFKGMDGELALHVPLEELLETTAHVLFLIAALRSGEREPEAGALPG